MSAPGLPSGSGRGTAAPGAERRAWSARVSGDIADLLGPLAGLTFEVHAGADHCAHGLEDGLRARGATPVRPTAGLSYGEQVAFYRRGSDAGSRAPRPAIAPVGPAPPGEGVPALRELLAAHEGEVFTAASGLAFTYRVTPSGIAHTRSRTELTWASLAEASSRAPGRLSELQDLWGSSCLFALVTDPRIRAAP